MRKIILIFVAFLVVTLLFNIGLVRRLMTFVGDGDRPFIIWTVIQNAFHLQKLDFVNLGQTNIFYPRQNTLFLSDTLLPISFFALPLIYLTDNYALIFNSLVLLTTFLNLVALFLFWQQVIKNKWLAFFGAVLFLVCPYYYLQGSHFQMFSYWPFFFSLVFFFKAQNVKTALGRSFYSILTGLLLTCQFLMSVYLAVFLITAILGYSLIFFLKNYLQPQKIKHLLVNLLWLFLIFALTAGVFIYQYWQSKKINGLKREYGEYVTYSAHPSDYLFTTDLKTPLYSLSFFDSWNNWNKHFVGERASFPGLLLTIISILAIIKNWSVNKKKIKNYTVEQLFFLFILMIGLIFSIGPRLNWNGLYLRIPLPYTFLVKHVVLFEPIRATARWSFLFYLALVYLALWYLQTVVRQKNLNYQLKILFLMFIWLVFEYWPLTSNYSQTEKLAAPYQLLANHCQKKPQVLLEIPVTHLAAGKNIYEGLSYLTRMEYDSLYHRCFLVNGYSGYLFPDLVSLDQKIVSVIANDDYQTLNSLLKRYGVDYLKINLDKANFPKSVVLKEKITRLPYKQIARNLYRINK